jgi:hypothetical protein
MVKGFRSTVKPAAGRKPAKTQVKADRKRNPFVSCRIWETPPAKPFNGVFLADKLKPGDKGAPESVFY